MSTTRTLPTVNEGGAPLIKVKNRHSSCSPLWDFFPPVCRSSVAPLRRCLTSVTCCLKPRKSRGRLAHRTAREIGLQQEAMKSILATTNFWRPLARATLPKWNSLSTPLRTRRWVACVVSSDFTRGVRYPLSIIHHKRHTMHRLFDNCGPCVVCFQFDNNRVVLSFFFSPSLLSFSLLSRSLSKSSTRPSWTPVVYKRLVPAFSPALFFSFSTRPSFSNSFILEKKKNNIAFRNI